MTAKGSAPGVPEVSIIMATATGEQHIEAALRSLLEQQIVPWSVELVVVVDGPNQRIQAVLERLTPDFNELGVEVTVQVSGEREGRFVARKRAAETARASNLLIVDDRNILDASFLRRLGEAVTDADRSTGIVVIPSLHDIQSPTLISRTLNAIRRRLYRGWDGTTQESFWVSGENFEEAAKTAGGLWVPRDAFLGALADLERHSSDLRFVNDDTRVLRSLLEGGIPILKSGEIVLRYEPRTRLSDEIRHLYGRGPVFIDYYTRRGTRFFPYLFAALVLLLAALIVLFLWPRLLIGVAALALVATLSAAIFLARRPSDVPRLVVGLPLVALPFLAGLVRGLSVRLGSGRRHR